MIGVVADDLTGATELGAVALRFGLRAEVLLDCDAMGIADVLCLDTESRSLPPAEARRAAAQAAAALEKAGASHIYKKVDSVLRGNVTVEIEAVLEALNLPRAVLVSANPGLGRVIRRGNYFVGETPLHETDFANDPEHPRRTSSVLELLAAPGSPAIHVGTYSGALPERGIVVGDAAGDADLAAWAGRCDDQTLVAGGAEFFAAWLARKLPRQAEQGSCRSGFSATASAPHDNAACAGGATSASRSIRRELFVCGSASETTAAFVNRQRECGVPVVGLPESLLLGKSFRDALCDPLADAATRALNDHARVILRIGLPCTPGRAVTRKLTEDLTCLAASVLARIRVDEVFAEGGATAASLARRMGWRRLEVLRELAPGVITLSPPGVSVLLLTVKPGSYAWPEACCQYAQGGLPQSQAAGRPLP
jgi:D-threonate/D-erythronate kinase